MKIDSCVCYSLSFAEILSLGWKTLEEVKAKEGICDRCEMCNPYVEESLKTGTTEFNCEL